MAELEKSEKSEKSESETVKWNIRYSVFDVARKSVVLARLNQTAHSARSSVLKGAHGIQDAILGVDSQTPQNAEEDDSDDSDAPLEKLSRKEMKQRIRKSFADERQAQRLVIITKSLEEMENDPILGMQIWKILGVSKLFEKMVYQKNLNKSAPPEYPGAHKLATSMQFELLMGCFILLNALTIGWSTFFDDDDVKPSILAASEHIFTLLFIVEWFIRIMAHTWVWMFEWPNACDTFLVWIGGAMVTWILVPAGADGTALKMLTALRILRLVRVVRVIRLHPLFKDLWCLVQGLTSSLRLVLWFYVIVGTVHFMFAIAMMETLQVYTTDDEVVAEWFGDVLSSMFTLFQIMTYDSYSGIVRHLMKEMEVVPLVLIFAFIGIAAIVLFNLMTAIVVDIAFQAREKDEEAVVAMQKVELKKKMARMKQMFKEMDEDNSGYLTKAEFTDVLDDPTFVQQMKIFDIEIHELGDVFKIMDDGDGKVSADEFCDGMQKMAGPPNSAMMYKCNRVTQKCGKNADKLANRMDDIADDDRLFTHLDRSKDDMMGIMAKCADIIVALNALGVRQMARDIRKTGLLPRAHDPNEKEIGNDVPKEEAALQKMYRKRLAQKRLDEAEGAEREQLEQLTKGLWAQGALDPEEEERRKKELEEEQARKRKRERREGKPRSKGITKRRSSLAAMPNVCRTPEVPSWAAQNWSKLDLSFDVTAHYCPPAVPPVVAPPPTPPPEAPPAPPVEELPSPMVIDSEAEKVPNLITEMQRQEGRRPAMDEGKRVEPAPPTEPFQTMPPAPLGPPTAFQRGQPPPLPPVPASLPTRPPAPREAPSALRPRWAPSS